MGSLLTTWLNLIETIGPYVLAAIPGVPAAVIPAVVHEIQVVEGLFTTPQSGAQKKASVLDAISTGLGIATAAAGKQIIDPTSTLAAVSSGIDATVNAINAIHSVTNPTT